MVAVLAGGTGGAKLAAGLYELLGPDELVVIANTADDVEVYGVHVSPDPDLVTWWLAGWIDERGWGIEGDTWSVMDALEAADRPVWFRLGDRDSLLSATLATETLVDALRRDALVDGGLAGYEARWREQLGAELESQATLRRVAERLTDAEIDGLFDLARTDGLMPLLRRTAAFNRHREFIVAGYLPVGAKPCSSVSPPSTPTYGRSVR